MIDTHLIGTIRLRHVRLSVPDHQRILSPDASNSNGIILIQRVQSRHRSVHGHPGDLPALSSGTQPDQTRSGNDQEKKNQNDILFPENSS